MHLPVTGDERGSHGPTGLLRCSRHRRGYQNGRLTIIPDQGNRQRYSGEGGPPHHRFQRGRSQTYGRPGSDRDDAEPRGTPYGTPTLANDRRQRTARHAEEIECKCDRARAPVSRSPAAVRASDSERQGAGAVAARAPAPCRAAVQQKHDVSGTPADQLERTPGDAGT
ncbi:MAG: hypothetical protein IIA55_14245 [Gemmatimonadetes bacterium]|nr:hypothetical protein [Gemmatimonadota bacterium]